MNSRERLMATLQGEKVDRPAVNLYEIGGLVMDNNDVDAFNVYNDPSWQPLLNLAEQQSDLIRMRSPVRTSSHEAWDARQHNNRIRDEFFKVIRFEKDGHRWVHTELNVARRQMRSVTRRDMDVDSIWTTEYLLKDRDDVIAFLQLPDEVFEETIDGTPLIEEEKRLGDRGIVMVDTEDPLCAAATLFGMGDFTIFAMTEKVLFHKLLKKCARYIYTRTETVARDFPGRLWRIYGPEFACAPFLPPRLFDEYVVQYTGPMIEMIKKYGGYARLHAHGKIGNVVEKIVQMGADAIDPIEPKPQGDVILRDLRQKYGRQLVLFGNIEITDIEFLKNDAFKTLVKRALEEGTTGQGRGFVLMPSASPFGRKIADRTMKNYMTMVNMTREFILS
jgi:uroporphyrinogen decarboxylase-like protein